MDIDQQLQEIIKTKRLLDYEGFKDFCTRVQELYDFKDNQIAQITAAQVSKEGLEVLNALIAERNALGTLLMLRQEMIDNVSPETDEGVKEDSEGVTRE